MVFDYIDEVGGIDKDLEIEEDYSEISEDYDDEDIDMAFPDDIGLGE